MTVNVQQLLPYQYPSRCHIPCCSGLLSLPLCRSVIVENSASSTNATEILKPVKKRKRKDYQSPSEDEYESEQMVGGGKAEYVCACADVKGGPWPPLHSLRAGAILVGAVSCMSKG